MQMPTVPWAAVPLCLHPPQPLEAGTAQSSLLCLMDTQTPWDRGICRWFPAECAHRATLQRGSNGGFPKALSQGDMRPGLVLGQL